MAEHRGSHRGSANRSSAWKNGAGNIVTVMALAQVWAPENRRGSV
jgi:hypothetical protein